MPYRVHTVLTDNGIQFTTPGAGGSAVPLIGEALAKGELFRAHAFEYACAKAGIEHRTTKPKHPWTNGQVERMNRTIKDATVKRFHYDDHDQLRRHLADFVAADNFGRRLKTLKGLTPYEFICKRWTTEPERFTLNPLQQMPGLNIYLSGWAAGRLSNRSFPSTPSGPALDNPCRSHQPRCAFRGRADDIEYPAGTRQLEAGLWPCVEGCEPP